jgi:hypothetical protein
MLSSASSGSALKADKPVASIVDVTAIAASVPPIGHNQDFFTALFTAARACKFHESLRLFQYPFFSLPSL